MLLKNHLEKKMADLSGNLNEGEDTQTAAGHWSSLQLQWCSKGIVAPPRPWGERGNRPVRICQQKKKNRFYSFKSLCREDLENKF